jgi:hypothetical protein
MIRLSTYLSLLIGFTIPALYLLSTDFVALLSVPIVLFGCWLASITFRWSWVYDLIFLFSIILLALAGTFLIPQFSAIVSGVFTLAAWDLSNYQRLLDRVDRTNQHDHLARSHLKKLVVFILSALILSLGANSIDLNISFIHSIILLIFGFIGLMQLIRWSLNQHKQQE